MRSLRCVFSLVFPWVINWKRYTSEGGSALAMISPACSSTSLVSTAALSILKAVILWLGMDSAKPNFPPSFLVIQQDIISGEPKIAALFKFKYTNACYLKQTQVKTICCWNHIIWHYFLKTSISIPSQNTHLAFWSFSKAFWISSVISATLTAVILLHLRICYTYKKQLTTRKSRSFKLKLQSIISITNI